MGFTFSERAGNRHRFTGGPRSLARYIDIFHRLRQPENMPDEAVFGTGSIHHIACRLASDEEQLEYHASVRAAGYGVTPVCDRNYFHTICCREPDGVLFEIAPVLFDFAIDESADRKEPRAAGVEIALKNHTGPAQSCFVPSQFCSSRRLARSIPLSDPRPR